VTDIFLIFDNSLYQGLQYGLLALSLFISLRLLDFPDLTIEGSFAAGAATTFACVHYFGLGVISLFVATVVGFLAGMCTGMLHTRLRIGKLLSGIIVAVGLYSINFRIMGAQANGYILPGENPASVLRIANAAVAGWFTGNNPARPLYVYPVSNAILLIGIALIILAIFVFLRSERGSVLRFTRAENKLFLESIGQDYAGNLVVGLGMANAVAALAGGLVAFANGSASLTMGFGIILVALVAVVLGEAIVQVFHRELTDLWPVLLAPIFGAFAYYLILRTVQELNTAWQIHHGAPDPTFQLQYFQTDVKLLSVAILVVISAFRRRQVGGVYLPERL